MALAPEPDARQALETLERMPVSRWHWNTFWILGLGLQFNGFLNSSGNSVLADLVVRGWSDNYLNAVFVSAMMGGFFVGSLVAGSLGDRIGRKRTYELRILVFGTFALAAALAPSMSFLIVCRGLMGIGMGGGIVLGYGSFTEFVPARVRGTWSARISLLGNLSPLIAAAVAAVLIPLTSWRATFAVGAVAAFVIAAVVHRCLDESPRWLIKAGRVDEAIAIVDRAAGRNLHDPRAGQEIERTPAPSAPGAEDRIPLRAFFRGDLGRRTLVATATLIAMNLSLYTITAWVPTIFVNRGIDITSSLTMTMAMMVGAPIGVFISTLIMDRFPRRVLGSTLIVAIAVLGYVYSLQQDRLTIVVVGTLMMIVLYVYNSFASAVYAPEVWPTAAKMRGLGLANSIGRVVAITSPYLTAWLLTDFGPVAVFAVLGALLLACALVLAVLGIETRGRTCEEMTDPTGVARRGGAAPTRTHHVAAVRRPTGMKSTSTAAVSGGHDE